VCLSARSLFWSATPTDGHSRIQTVLRADAEKRRVMRVIQSDVNSECSRVNSCADADGASDENLG